MTLDEAFATNPKEALICRKSGSEIWEIGLLKEAIDFSNSITFSLLRKLFSSISKKDMMANDWEVISH